MLLEYAFDGRRRAVSFSSARWASACRRSIRSTQRGWSLFSRPRTIALEHDRPECGDASDDTNAQFTPRRLMQRSGALLLMTAGVGHLTRLGSVRPQAHPTIDISIYVHIVTSSSPRHRLVAIRWGATQAVARSRALPLTFFCAAQLRQALHDQQT
jgi:hypothetical protein